ncbi:37529_t:CDS:2, partial [Gigaspora margarita]
YTNQYDIYIDQPNYTLPSTSRIDNLETTKLTPSQPIQSISSETIIDIDFISTFLESDNLNTETSQTIYNISTSTIEFEQDQTTTFYSVLPSPIQILDSRSAPVSPIIPPILFNISSTPSNISLLTSTTDHWSSVAINRNIEQSSSSSYTLLYPQLDTSNNFSPKISPISISTQYIVPLSPLVLPTTYHTTDYNIGTSYQTNIEQSSLYLRIDEATWDTFYPDNYNTETQYTSIYTNIFDTKKTTQTPINNQSDSDSEQSFGKTYTAILNQVQTLNNNTDNQGLSSNHPNLTKKVNLEIEAKAKIEITLRSVVDLGTENINKLTLPNDPGEESSNSFIITTEVFNQSIEDIKGKQPQYDTKMPI